MSAEYNGWKGFGTRSSAYATWRIALEVFDDPDVVTDAFDHKPEVHELADYMRDYVGNIVAENCSDPLVSGLAYSFLENVDYREIAENILADWPEE